MELVENELEENFFCSNKTSVPNFLDIFVDVNTDKVNRPSSVTWGASVDINDN